MQLASVEKWGRIQSVAFEFLSLISRGVEMFTGLVLVSLILTWQRKSKILAPKSNTKVLDAVKENPCIRSESHSNSL